jgi:A/G-specific adenine glycosylase
VWISELMLQQTRVDTVIPYYRRFMKRFPSVRSLALADRQDVLKHWEGLGYYARARNLHHTAHIVHHEYRNRFPRTAAELNKLPGIGPYSAAAIASMAFGEAAAVLDGNVIRVLTRVTGDGRDVGSAKVRKSLQVLADELIPSSRPGEFNEAMMELGALVCTPRNPRCEVCPLRPDCRACKEKKPEAYPRKKKKARVPHKIVGAAVIINSKGRVLIAQRPDHKMLGGLWEFPGGVREEGETLPQCIEREIMEELGLKIRCGDHLCSVKHAYSHFTIELHAYFARIEKGRPRCLDCAAYAWESPEGIRRYALSKADVVILNTLSNTELPRS